MEYQVFGGSNYSYVRPCGPQRPLFQCKVGTTFSKSKLRILVTSIRVKNKKTHKKSHIRHRKGVLLRPICMSERERA